MIRKFLYILLALVSLISCQKDDLSDLKDILYIRRNGADMPAYIYGNGKSKVFILLLHGGPGGSGLEYRTGGYSDILEDKYAMVYWDQRGQGMSQGHYHYSTINLDEMTMDVKALALVIKHKYGNDSKLFLMGHSWGGMLGTATLIKDDFQNLFNGWIEIDGSHDFPLLYKSAVSGFIKIGQEQINSGNNVEYWQSQIDFVSKIDTSIIDEETFDELNSRASESEDKLLDDGVLSETEGTINALGVIFQNNFITSTVSGSFTSNYLFEQNNLAYLSLTNELDKIKIPSLLIWGKYDLIVPLDLGVSALNKLGSQKKQLVIFNYSAHSPMMHEPERFTSVVIDFIEQNKN